MLQQFVKCEMCSNQFEVHPRTRAGDWEAPQGWLLLHNLRDMRGEEGQHFCSERCLQFFLSVPRG
jgi:YHS domain-containing protein